MKRYPSYKDSGIEWIGEIPEHWEVKPLKYTAKINQDSLPENTHEDYEIQYIDIGNVNQDGLVNHPKVMSFGISPSRARRVVKKGDTIVSTVRTYLKAISYINSEDENLIASTGFAVLTPTDLMSAMYLYCLISTQKIIDTISSLSVGVSYPAINSSDLGSIPIWFPKAIEEQQTIANYLDRKTHLIDTLIEKKQKLIDLLKEQRAAIINQVVTKGMNPNVKLKDSGIEWLGEIPEHWGIARLKFISNIKYGLGQPPRALEGGLPIIRATNIKEGKISPDDLLYVDPKDVPYDRDPILKENDIIVVRSGAYTGDSAIIPREYEGAVAGYDMVACAHKANPEYIAYSLLSHSILHNQIDLCRLRAAQPHLNAEELGDTLVFLPPNDEQKMIVEFIKHESEMIVSINQNLEELIKFLKEYRTALISEVVTGKIDVRDSGEQEVIHS